VAPLSPGRYRVQFTVDTETYQDLRLAQDLFRREIPDGDPGAIFGRALKLLLAQAAKDKAGAASTPGPVRPVAPGSRHIPAVVKRAVWLRDRGQCAFVAKLGRRCTERAFLELHHIHPFAHGGEATVANISLRCRRHNAHESDLVFGPRLAGEAKAPATDARGRQRAG
jgi:HNH endonuclease